MNKNKFTAELREKLQPLTDVCPKGNYTADCPFGLLGGMNHDTRNSVFERMNHDELLRLFDLPSDCDCPADPRK